MKINIYKNILIVQFTIISIILLCFILQSCEDSIEPQNSYKFNNIIASHYGTAIIKSDGSLWGGPCLSRSDITQYSKSTYLGDTLIKNRIIQKAISIHFHMDETVIADRDGNIWIWCGAFGNNMRKPVFIPQKIGNLPLVRSINSFGLNINMACEDGSLWKITMDPLEPFKYINPVRFDSINDILKVSASLALKKNGTLVEFEKSEQINGGLIKGITEVMDFDNVWGERTVILKKDKTVWAWGQNYLGQLGNGTFENSAIPVKVKNLDNVTDISSNFSCNLALKEDGSVWFWGYVGVDKNNKTYGISTPERIDCISDVSIIFTGDRRFYFMKKDGTYWLYDILSKILKQIILIEE